MSDSHEPIKTDCYCPETPHEADEFYLVDAEHLPPEAGIAAANAISSLGAEEGLTVPGGDVAAALIGAFLRFGAIRRWNLVDDKGNDVPINPGTVRDRLTWVKGGRELSQEALGRYITAKTLTPFGLSTSVKRTRTSSNSGRTARSTSAKTSSSLQALDRSA